MKTIGLIGGMSYESTIDYYQIINQTINNELQGLHSAKIILYSVDFALIDEYQNKGEWHQCAILLTECALSLQKAGADYIILCSNTVHKVIDEIQKHISIPVIHIVDALIDELNKYHISRIGLLATKYTMMEDFYKSRLNNAGIEVIIPSMNDINIIHHIIFNELCQGIIKEESKKEYLRIIQNLKELNIQAIVLGCTEIGMLIKQEDIDLLLFDTTMIHAKKAAYLAL